MKDDRCIALLKNKNKSDITVLVIAESAHQRLAFGETVRSCGFTLVDSISRAQLRQYAQVDIWLVDSVYDDHVAAAIGNSCSSAVLVGFSQAPYLNEMQHYSKWQRKLKRKLAQILAMPTLMDSSVYDKHIKPWNHVVFLGASMGGPNAVKTFLDHLAPTLPVCILLAHHFNCNMIETLPRILTRHNDWRCQIITTTQKLKSGYCLIAPIDQKIVCDSEGRIILSDQAWSGEYRPSIGQLLKNVSDVYGNELVSIIFSGMGNDGSQYLDMIQDNHSQLWAQDPSLSTCASQPQAIIDSGYCHFIGSPEALAQKLTDYVTDNTSTPSLF